MGLFRFFVLLSLSLASLVADHRYHQLGWMRSALATSLYPLQYLSQAPLRVFEFSRNYLQSHDRLVTLNQALQQEQFLQNSRLQRLLAVEAENWRLRHLLHSSKNLDLRFQAAEVIQQAPALDRHYLILNKGKKAGVTVGQPVIDSEGVIGEVVEVYPYSCKIIEITDSRHAIPVENTRNQVRGILHGLGHRGEMKLQHTFGSADLQVGDVLMTSGLGGNYPHGYPVGEVKAIIQADGEPFSSFLVRPLARMDRVRQVLLIQSVPSSGTDP